MTLPTDSERTAITICEALLEKLKNIICEETAALEQWSTTPLEHFAARKNQLLRDLLNAQRASVTPVAQQALLPKSRELRLCLAHNQHLLKSHIDAVKEVSAIIVDSIREAESDGTYSRNRYG